MALAQTLCSSFKQESWLAIHDLDTDVLKMALYTSVASLGADTTVYTPTGEVSGTNYLVSGQVLTNVQVLLSGTTAYVTFDNPVWDGVSFTARGALIITLQRQTAPLPCWISVPTNLLDPTSRCNCLPPPPPQRSSDSRKVNHGYVHHKSSTGSAFNW